VTGGSAENGDDTLGDDRSSDVTQLQRVGGTAGALSFPPISLPDREPPVGHIKFQPKVGIPVWAIEHRQFAIESHPEREAQTVQWVPRTFDEPGVPTAHLESLCNGLEGRSNHAVDESFGVPDELSTLVCSLDLVAAKGSSSSRPHIVQLSIAASGSCASVSDEVVFVDSGLRIPPARVEVIEVSERP
jgi:hypothetical protein